jgi:hypothetical protein
MLPFQFLPVVVYPCHGKMIKRRTCGYKHFYFCGGINFAGFFFAVFTILPLHWLGVEQTLYDSLKFLTVRGLGFSRGVNLEGHEGRQAAGDACYVPDVTAFRYR